MKININKERFNGENFVLDKERGFEGTLASNVKPWLKYLISILIPIQMKRKLT